MIVTDVFKNAMTATMQVENGIASIAVIHTPESGYPPAIFEMHIDKFDEFYTLCRKAAGEHSGSISRIEGQHD